MARKRRRRRAVNRGPRRRAGGTRGSGGYSKAQRIAKRNISKFGSQMKAAKANRASMRNKAAARHAKFKQTRVSTDGGRKTSFTKAEQARIRAAGYTVEGYSKAAYSEDGGRAAREARKKNLDRNLKNFDAKSYLARYKDLRDAFGTDEAAARKHYMTHGFDENRDISKLKTPGLAAGQEKKGYEQNRQVTRFADDRAQSQLGKVGNVVQGVQKVGKFIGNNPLQSLKIGKAALQDMAQLNNRYNQDTYGRQYSEKGKTDLYRAPRESLLKQDIRDVSGMVKIGRDFMGAEGRDDKLNVIANADPNSLKAFGTKAYPALQASNLAQVAGEMAGLPTNFKMQIDQSKQELQNRLNTVKIGDRDSTYKAVSDLARDIGTDPNLGFVSRLAKQYEQNNPYASNVDRLKAAFDISQERVQGLNRQQRGLIEGALGNRIISGKLTDIGREGMQGLPTGQTFDADTLTALVQNVSGNFTDPDSIASKRGSEIKKLVDPKPGSGINITVPSIIRSSFGLNKGGSGQLAATSSAGLTIGDQEGNNQGGQAGGNDSDNQVIGGGEGDTEGGNQGDNEGGNQGDNEGGSGNQGGDNSSTIGESTTPGYNSNTDQQTFQDSLRGLRFNDPDYRARLRRRRQRLLGFRKTFRRPNAMTIA
mgnify:CR=1 FL=1